ncbi:hypothetical protein [Shewanella morhuae]|uniref:Apea-like HEPN domain-containing protein n=1 Tax=Shewanella morhuae TaxID=365591 RepID=A0A380B5W1_9GAMM|nr:hypothetical protein [Shewanella morhuae]SUI93638.1 Uncharacterised protein [Shewanella morhuae]
MINNTELDRLASKFFKEFSRSEYALKAAGFHNGNGNAEANWSTFAKEVETLVHAPHDQTLDDAINFIMNHPPKKQVILDGKIQWSEAAPNARLKADNLLIYVRRIRNNLFHGGKFNDQWFEEERSELLIQNGLIILNACIHYVKSTREAYSG